MTKKALIVGGSNGIGLAIGANLINKGYKLVVCDLVEMTDGSIDKSKVEYHFCNLLDFDEELFYTLAKDEEIEVLMITAGLGRVADLDYLHTSEIDKLMKINAIGTMKLLRIFYDRIKNSNTFYTGVMGSIAGLVSSPMFSVYAASKAAVCRFVESVNIELEVAGVNNRILNVSPGSIKGSKFNGGENDLKAMENLADDIVAKLLNKEELFIPQYEEIYKGVIERYQRDGHEYGLHSYQYKLNSGRSKNENKAVIGYLSGTFDLFHIGHLNLLRRAKAKCDYLIVGVHPDASHKGKQTFISFEERKAIVEACRYVDKVVQSQPEDCDAWPLYHYNRLFVGSDYKGTERFLRYEEYFSDKDCEIVYFPYTTSTSSTQIRNAVAGKTDK